MSRLSLRPTTVATLYVVTRHGTSPWGVGACIVRHHCRHDTSGDGAVVGTYTRHRRRTRHLSGAVVPRDTLSRHTVVRHTSGCPSDGLGRTVRDTTDCRRVNGPVLRGTAPSPPKVSYSTEGEDYGCEGEGEAKWCSIMARTSSSSSERPSWICMHRETPSAVVTHCRGCKTARGTGRGGGAGGADVGHGPKLLHFDSYSSPSPYAPPP